MRYVKFSPEEMAYDVPDDTSGWVPVGRGAKTIFAKPPKAGTTVRLDADVAEVFKDAAAVNKALRKLIEAMPPAKTPKRRSS